jgi:hypothetical protein
VQGELLRVRSRIGENGDRHGRIDDVLWLMHEIPIANDPLVSVLPFGSIGECHF